LLFVVIPSERSDEGSLFVSRNRQNGDVRRTPMLLRTTL
jgi:hypothetical protein